MEPLLPLWASSYIWCDCCSCRFLNWKYIEGRTSSKTDWRSFWSIWHIWNRSITIWDGLLYLLFSSLVQVMPWFLHNRCHTPTESVLSGPVPSRKMWWWPFRSFWGCSLFSFLFFLFVSFSMNHYLAIGQEEAVW